MLCKYKNALGEPKKGVHSYRVFNLAIVDVIMTVVVSFGIAWVLKTSVLWTTLVVFLIGIGMHWVFCVDTTINRIIFGKMN